jgi:hypothetical protein
MKRFQRRTVKSPCCNTKIHVRFQYGALIIGAFCDCGKPFYLKFKEVKSRIKGFKGKRAGRLIMKTDTNPNNIVKMKQKAIKKRKQKKKKGRKHV